MHSYTSICALHLVGALLLLTYFVNAKLLNVEFSGFVDSEAATFEQFCPAMWVTFAQLSWADARAYCNSTTEQEAKYNPDVIRDNIVTVVQSVNVTVAHFASEIHNLTVNLQQSGFLYSSENVSNISDQEFNKTVGMMFTSFICSAVLIFNVLMCIFCR